MGKVNVIPTAVGLGIISLIRPLNNVLWLPLQSKQFAILKFAVLPLLLPLGLVPQLQQRGKSHLEGGARGWVARH
jgi:hypothetical protein